MNCTLLWWQKLLLILFSFSWHTPTFNILVSANTEIVNFEVGPSSSTGRICTHPPQIPIDEWPVLRYTTPKKRWDVQPAPLDSILEQLCEKDTTLVGDQMEKGDAVEDISLTRLPSSTPCPHELWVLLDLNDEEWRRYNKFTLRLSWPASSPADFLIDIYDHTTLFVPNHTSSPRRKYARIRVVDTGILTPFPASQTSSTDLTPGPVPFILILEPLYFGVLPESAVLVLYFLIPVVLLAGLAVPRVNKYLGEIASLCRREMVMDGSRGDAKKLEKGKGE